MTSGRLTAWAQSARSASFPIRRRSSRCPMPLAQARCSRIWSVPTASRGMPAPAPFSSRPSPRWWPTGTGSTRRSSPSSPLAAARPARTAGQTGWFRSMTACATQRPAPISRTTTPWSCLGALQAQGLRVEHYYPELGHGQQEMSIGHAPALRAADNHVLYRESVRGIAFRRGLWASLAPKPIPDQAGNGTHLHGSLTDLNSDGSPRARNLFHAGDQFGLAAPGYHFIAGLLAHLPGRTALTCASVNSYRRLVPQSWSSAYTIYGMDNREAAVRICSPLHGDAASSVNLELKPSDSSANPYLALGAFIYAGLDGIRGKLDPGEAVNTDPAALTDPERDKRGIQRLPGSLGAALDALAADELLMDALGPLRRTAYFAVKRSEVAAFAEHDAAWECFHHFTKF